MLACRPLNSIVRGAAGEGARLKRYPCSQARTHHRSVAKRRIAVKWENLTSLAHHRLRRHPFGQPLLFHVEVGVNHIPFQFNDEHWNIFAQLLNRHTLRVDE